MEAWGSYEIFILCLLSSDTLVGVEMRDFLAGETIMARKGLDFKSVDYEDIAGSLTFMDLVSMASAPKLQFGVGDYDYRAFHENENGCFSLMYGLVLGVLCISSIAKSAVPKDPFLGIPPQGTFGGCGGGGSGTSACPEGKFYCRNSGHIPVLLFSSRVNDGICVNCRNTCWEAGKVARDKLRKKIATYKEGVVLRKQEVEQAKLAITKDEAELSKLIDEENILKGLVQQLKERKEQIEKAEEKERLQKEKEENEKNEAEEKASREKGKVEEEAQQEKGGAMEKANVGDNPAESVDNDKIGVLDDSSLDQDEAGEHDDHVAEAEIYNKIEGSSENEVKQHVAQEEENSISPESKDDSAVENDLSKNTEGLSKEELGRLVASRWTGSSESKTEAVDVAKDDHGNHEDHEEMPPDMHDEEYDGYASETDDDTGKYDDVDTEDDMDETYERMLMITGSSYKPDPEDDIDLSDITSSSNPSWLEKIQQTVRNILHAVNIFQTPVDKSEAAHIRKEYEESSTKLSKIQSRISSLTQKLKHDFGTEKEFYSFYDHCFESKQNKRWDKFEDLYRTMIFSNGERCWNGPARSLKVKLRCGLKNELTDIDEPSRCEYVAFLSTPALCLDEKLKELEDKLELVNREQPQGHDEL
ncbi:hypothetical protein GH714_025307 [Hevea brasiliensis]|uniref:Glucosidase 2 subunit beta n=1 Tax=Hevea brasiliensis TaxID=3981 RepID=A0A6A6LR95_HEVBR|nr:hypothetical protein GH714_025307 [Hevea brasiliensis]